MAKSVLPQKLHSTFHNAIKDGDLNSLISIFKDNKIDINASLYKVYPNSYPLLLFFAIFEGNFTIQFLDFFLENNVNLELTGYNGGNALFSIWRSEKNIPVLQKLLTSKINVNHKNNDGTTFLTLITREFGDKLTYLRTDDQKVPIRNEDEYFNTRFQFIEILLKSGADPNLKNNYGTSALDWIEHRKSMNEFDEWDQKLLNTFLLYKI